MIVDLECWLPLATGRMIRTGDSTGAYVAVADVEQLLEEAHRRGFEAGKRAAEQERKL